MIDQIVSHYRILKKLGEGGMGEVYLAEDISLNRKVALKFLPEHLHQDELAHKRFLREAESAAALEHPYICNIKEVARTEGGQDFIVMEYVEGQTLQEKLAQGPLSVEETIQICCEIADALAMAHNRGIVHRDLKPANIMLTLQGHAKVMDFGLAKRVGAEEGTEQDLTGLTREGFTLGTPAYMSPEQVRSGPLDHRTDLFSFGILFYEMLTGTHPFRRGKPVETMGAILHEEPEPLAKLVPGATELLQETVTRMLAKDPGERMQTVEEVTSRLNQLFAQEGELKLATFLRSRPGRLALLALAAIAAVVLIGWWAFQTGPTGVGGPVVSSIAVLPLANLSGDPEQEYFIDGMTEALITDLSKIGALKVISRSSAMRYKNTDKSLSEIAQELDVEAVIEGSVLREGDQVRITAQLIEAGTERNLWAERYERSLTSILALQGEVAQAIAREIRVTLTPGEESLLTRRRQVNPEAYEAFLRGQFHWYKLTAADLETALQYFESALEKDPDYALAHVGISLVWIGLQQMGYAPPLEAGPKARVAALRAVELDDTLVEAHYALALVKTWVDWDWQGGERSFLQAIRLNPNYADVRAYYSHYLMIMRRPDEAMAQMHRALELDPFNPLFRALYGVVLLASARRFDDAIEQAREALRSVPNHPVAFWCLSEALYMKKMYKETIESFRAYFAAEGNSAALEILDRGYAEGGFTGAMRLIGESLAALSREAYVAPSAIANFYVYAEMDDEALEWLEKTYEMRDPTMPYVDVFPSIDGIRNDPRYQNLIRRMNLP